MTTEQRRAPAGNAVTSSTTARQPDGASAATATEEERTRPTGPMISCVIPTFNGERFLREAIDSVLEQDYPNIECIVIDAGSTDGTIDILKSYGDRIQWRSRPDRGAFDAINEGWKMSQGEILAWVNSDDRWEPGAARVAARYFSNHPEIDVFYGTCGGIDPEGNIYVDYPPREWDLHFALQNCDHIINQTASFIRREMLEKVDFLYPAWCHDHDLWLRIAVEGGQFGVTTRRLGSARIWPDNLGNSPAIIVPGKVGLTRRIFENPKLPQRLRGMKDQAISNAYLRCIFYISPAKPKNWLTAAKLFISAVSAKPLNVFYLSSQVGYVLLSRTIGGLGRRLYYGGRKLARGLMLPLRGAAAAAQAPWRARIAVAPYLIAAARLLLPIAAVGIPAAIVWESELGTKDAAQTFAMLAVPLLAAVFLYTYEYRRP